MKMKKPYYFIFLVSLLCASCGNSEDPINSIDACPDNIGCTEIFVSLTFSPKDNNNQGIVLDTFYSQNLDNGNTYSTPNASLAQQNSYTVITDAALEEIDKDGTNIRFIGLQGDQIVVQQDFVVGHDCCHVVPVSGPFDGQ